MGTKSSAPSYKGGEFIRVATGGTRDILTVLLVPDKLYTEDAISKMVSEYLAKEVKT